MDTASLLIGLGLGMVIGGLGGALLVRLLLDRSEATDITKQISALKEFFGGQLQTQTESTTKIHERLAIIDRAREQIGNLSNQTTRLEHLLSNNQRRGAFGETQLTDLIREMFGDNKAIYKLQATLSNKKRVDCLLNLPNPPGPIGIDAKYSLAAWYALGSATTDAERTNARKQLETTLIGHINDIASRYIIPGETADCALMFVPSEAVFAEIHSQLPRVLDVSFQQRVLVVSPTTMMAILNSVRAVMRDAEMSENVMFIKQQVHRLLNDVGRLVQRVRNLKQHLSKTHDDIHDIQVSTDKIARTGDAIEKIDTSSDAEKRLPDEPDDD